MRSCYAAIAREFDRSRRVPWREFALFLPYLKKRTAVLDAGCGNGRLFEYIQRREIRYTGIDNCETLIDIAKKRYPKIDFKVEEITGLKEPDRHFDVVFCIATLHHLPGGELRKKTLDELRRVLKKKGVLILTVWNLRQKSFMMAWISAFVRSLVWFGRKGGPKDLWVHWGKRKEKRYFHAFSPEELQKTFESEKWDIREAYGTLKGHRVRWSEAHNFCIIAQKRDA